MYSIQFSDWGLVLEFIGPISEEIIQDWLYDLEHLTGGLRDGFGVVIDVRDAQPDTPLVSAGILRGLRDLERAGMARAAVIIDEELGAPWAIPQATADPSSLRRVKAESGPKWLTHAHGWVQRGILQ